VPEKVTSSHVIPPGRIVALWEKLYPFIVNGSPERTGLGAIMIVGIPTSVVADEVELGIIGVVAVGLETGALVHPNSTDTRKAKNINKTYFFILLLYV
jgi:hypothetical protein